MIRTLVLVGRKRNVYGLIRECQTGPVVLILRTESDHTTYSRRGCCNRYRGIRSFIASDEVQGVEAVEERERRKGAPAGVCTQNFRGTNHENSIARRIDHGCSGDPYLRINVAKAAEASVADIIPDHRLLSCSSTM